VVGRQLGPSRAKPLLHNVLIRHGIDEWLDAWRVASNVQAVNGGQRLAYA